ncbi:S-adenosyl-L-methionine-dependent methyltransferase [Phlebopus sp. FC_14]|nr:S-adenosyl-L-methionine-dependent methyltransferase [Phlebopus sp. FC_14]
MLPPSHQPQRLLGRERAQDADAAVRQTDTDAAHARLSAVKKGYLQDPYIAHLVPRAHLQPTRPPLINIGTYVRSESIDRLVDQWMELAGQEGKQCQIVSLGAGSDTRFWRITTGPQKDRLKVYFELDFSEVTLRKAMAIRKSKELSAVLGPPESIAIGQGGTALHSPSYHLLPCDLRQPPSDVLPSLFQELMSPTLPTLLLFECVLVYMSPQASSSLIQWFVDVFTPASGASDSGALGAIVYEMFGLQDAFGQVMMNNLRSRNVSLPGAVPYPTLQSLPGRFTRHNFIFSNALTLRQIREQYIIRSELERISRLEMLDEIEELNLVLEHYAVTWGVKTPKSSETLWRNWGLTAPPSLLLQDE